MLRGQPQLRLADVLRRRRSTLKTLVSEIGLTTYTGLSIWCDRMGMVPPSQEEFDAIFPPEAKVNSPQEGVIVLPAPPLISESSGRPIEIDTPCHIEVFDEYTEASQKRRKARKEGLSNAS